MPWVPLTGKVMGEIFIEDLERALGGPLDDEMKAAAIRCCVGCGLLVGLPTGLEARGTTLTDGGSMAKMNCAQEEAKALDHATLAMKLKVGNVEHWVETDFTKSYVAGITWEQFSERIIRPMWASIQNKLSPKPPPAPMQFSNATFDEILTVAPEGGYYVSDRPHVVKDIYDVMSGEVLKQRESRQVAAVYPADWPHKHSIQGIEVEAVLTRRDGRVVVVTWEPVP